MRDLKFRMLTQTTDKILGYVDIYDLLRNGSDVLPDFEEAVLEGVKFEQDTGLKDKNGKEIYENDIVEDESGNIWRVEFRAGGFYPFSRPYSSPLGCPFGDEVEVIGNIHENPELLEGEE